MKKRGNDDIHPRFLVENQIYFDTSSINEIISNPIEDCIATQHLWAKKGRRMCISALNLYEIFKTSNEQKREEIIYKIGVLFYGSSGYMDTPTRILFGEVLEYGTGELTDFEKALRDSWFNVKRNPKNVGFNLDFEDFNERRNQQKFLFKTLKIVLKKEYEQMGEEEVFTLRNNIDSVSFMAIMGIKKIIKKFPKIEANNRNHVTLVLIYFIFCFGIEPQSDFIEDYWKSKNNDKLESILARAFYLIENYYESLFNSPFLKMMTDFIIHESSNKGIGRGTMSDALHLIYSFYCLFFITDDRGIIEYAKTENFLKPRVFSVKEDFSKVKEKNSDKTILSNITQYLFRLITSLHERILVYFKIQQ